MTAHNIEWWYIYIFKKKLFIFFIQKHYLPRKSSSSGSSSNSSISKVCPGCSYTNACNTHTYTHLRDRIYYWMIFKQFYYSASMLKKLKQNIPHILQTIWDSGSPWWPCSGRADCQSLWPRMDQTSLWSDHPDMCL